MNAERKNLHDDAVPDIDFRAVANVAQRAGLRGVRLARSQVGIFVPSSAVEVDWPLKTAGWYRSDPVFEDEDAAVSTPFDIECSFILRYTAGRDARENSAPSAASDESEAGIAVEAAFLLTYELLDLDNLTRSDLQHFAMANGTHNAWPYWREYAQSVSMRMGVTPYVAPPFKLPSSDDPASSPSAERDETDAEDD